MTYRTPEHEKRMAGLTADARNVSLGPRGIRLLGELRDYCNDLAAALEAERSKLRASEAEREGFLSMIAAPPDEDGLPRTLGEAIEWQGERLRKLEAATAEAFALRIWSVLCEYVGASLADQDNFVQHMAGNDPPSEWRFGGTLGFGGKFYPAEMAVRCYPEDETPARLAAIRNANVALARLAKRHGKRMDDLAVAGEGREE